MRSRTVIVLATVFVALIIGSSKSEDARSPPVKLDKNLRKALLKALADLDEESAEQKSLTRDANFDETGMTSSSEPSLPNDEQTKPLESVKGTIFSFDDFPSDDESPSEDKLQNSTYVEHEKYMISENSKKSSNQEKVKNEKNDEKKAFQAHDVILPDKTSGIYEKSSESVYDQLATRSVKSSSSSSTINVIENTESKDSANQAETLASSSSNGIAQANALVQPSPTVSSPIDLVESKNITNNISSPSNDREGSKTKKESQEVKIFQAPLVAAFTVQQDERGVPKSVVPIYSPNGDGQALTLQEQLDFKQQLLERQLAELQAQQIQQTQFLVRQQQIYEQQLRQKQQEQLYIQEQNRLKQLQDEQLRLKQLDEQRIYHYQQQKLSQQYQTQQSNSLHSLQPPFKTSNVHVQPSLTLELPKSAVPPTFQPNYQEQLRIQQLQRQQQLQQQQQQQQQTQLLQQQQRQQQLLQQQRLQQSFSQFPIDLQPPTSSPAQRFNRQEAFGNVGNFGFNENRQQQQQHNNRNQFAYNNQLSRGPQTFGFNPYNNQQSQSLSQYRQNRPQTPAKQIQHLLYQSGVAGDLGTVQGMTGGGGQEDLNIVSKVLALNVGALPVKNQRYNNFVNNA